MVRACIDPVRPGNPTTTRRRWPGNPTSILINASGCALPNPTMKLINTTVEIRTLSGSAICMFFGVSVSRGTPSIRILGDPNTTTDTIVVVLGWRRNPTTNLARLAR